MGTTKTVITDAAAPAHRSNKDGSSSGSSPEDESVKEVDPDDVSAAAAAASSQTKQRRAARIECFRRTFSWRSLVDPTQDWILMADGSFLGFFDWVPKPLRVGPWSVAAISYLSALYYLTALVAAYYYYDASSLVDARTRSTDSSSSSSTATIAAWTAPWYYHIAAFGWMNYINYLIFTGSLFGTAAWSTYTVQSWTLLTLRHGWCAAAPYWTLARRLADYSRFPAACSATITFCVWNGILAPGVYLWVMKTEKARRDFWSFSTSFRLMNIHVLNIVLVLLNCGHWADPPVRNLEWFPDFYLAVSSAMLYLALYFFVYDRLGFHLYPIFSPRSGFWTVLLVWSVVTLSYLACFVAWRQYLLVS
jgi:hypothetical protein